LEAASAATPVMHPAQRGPLFSAMMINIDSLTHKHGPMTNRMTIGWVALSINSL